MRKIMMRFVYKYYKSKADTDWERCAMSRAEYKTGLNEDEYSYKMSIAIR